MNTPWLNEFPLEDDILYLNHAAVSPWPKRAHDAVVQFSHDNMTVGSRHYLQWMQTEQTLKQQLARLINAPSADDIALLKNTSEALSVVAYGIDWRHGDNIVSSDEEFPSNRIIWQSLEAQGVSLRQANLADESSPEDALFAQVDKNTRMIAISSVQYASGLKMDLKRIGEYCQQRNILFCVDAIQSIGAVEFDVQACHIDFAMADGHKWMLGPEGLALFYVRPALRDTLQLKQFGWHMTEDYLNFDAREWQAASNARRFECGSPNMLAAHALQASTSL
ncbi:MAG: aminotransferase class V-fold PLP-dependent enzyme, partial [Gammaproteobacteria bacterium]|nr:aminotransferase class V-fold PLP-dependent enzyme [Gammaproteobacteria bacterium]